MAFGAFIKRMREDVPISAQKLADLIGINANRLRKWEEKDMNPRTEDVNLIEEFFGLEMKKILELTSIKKFVKVPNTLSEPQTPYYKTRHRFKNEATDVSLTFYEIGAHASTVNDAEILPVHKSEGVLHISDLFKGSQFAIRISGNSMTPNYPSGAIIGIREIEDKQITPGSVYVIEKGNDLWIKRLFYKDDSQESGFFECVSDNTMLFDKGPRVGKLYYPPFNISIDHVRKLFKVTGIYKPNELTVIN